MFIAYGYFSSLVTLLYHSHNLLHTVGPMRNNITGMTKPLGIALVLLCMYIKVECVLNICIMRKFKLNTLNFLILSVKYQIIFIKYIYDIEIYHVWFIPPSKIQAKPKAKKCRQNQYPNQRDNKNELTQAMVHPRAKKQKQIPATCRFKAPFFIPV